MTAPDSGYQPSPRPSYDTGTAVPRSAAARHVWGDPEAGEILDLIYVSGEQIHQLVFEIPPGGQFTHSPEHRTVFGADEVLYAVAGHVAVADPEAGRVVRLSPGDAVFFGAGTWHHTFNWGTGRPGCWSTSRRRRRPARPGPTPGASRCWPRAGTATTPCSARWSPAPPGPRRPG